MSESRQQSEDRVISLLHRGLADADRVPTDVTEFAKAALAWRTIEAELARLAYDSGEETSRVGVRSASMARMISFEAGDRLIDVEYSSVASRLMGQIEPATIMPVELHLSGSVVVTESDDLGRFAFEGVLPGPIALVFRISEEESVKTEWVVI